MLRDISETALVKPSNNLTADVSNEFIEQQSLHTMFPYKRGDIICSFEAAGILNAPTRHTLQVGENKHIILRPAALEYINHSCSPNVYFNTSAMQLICFRQIQAGDELTCFYPATEWSMVNPFTCSCGSGNCIKKVMGARYLSTEILKKYKLTDFIANKLLAKR